MRKWVCKLIVANAVLAAQLLTAGTSIAQEKRADVRLLSIGIGEYRSPLKELVASGPAAKHVYSYFENQGRLINGECLTNEEATLDAIRNGLRHLKQHANVGETVVVYITTHGMQTSGHWIGAPYDFDPENLESTCLSDKELLDELRSMIVRGIRVVLLLDSCFAGQIQKEASDLLQTPRSEFLLCASCSSTQPSWQSSEFPLFTRSFLEGFYGRADDNDDGFVTINELRRYMSWRLPEIMGQISRIPGFPTRNQDYVIEISGGLTDSIALSRSVVSKGSRALDCVLPLDAKQELINPEMLIGKWSATLPGLWNSYQASPRVGARRLDLTISAEGKYKLVLNREDQKIEEFSGRISYDQNKGIILDYGSGFDVMSIAGLSADVFSVTIPETWRFWPEDRSHEPVKLRDKASFVFYRQASYFNNYYSNILIPHMPQETTPKGYGRLSTDYLTRLATHGYGATESLTPYRTSE